VPIRNWIVVPAAGASRRVGGPRPKQYLEVHGRTLLEHALVALLSRADIDGGVVVLGAGDEDWTRLPATLRARLTTTVGGRERCHSVLAGLAALAAADEDWVLVHDAARPCLGAAELGRLIDACRADTVGGLLALPVTDTLQRADDAGRAQATIARESLWRAQTPQMFRHGPLKRALAAAIAAGEIPGDEATAMARIGLRPLLIEGSPLNIKVTRPADLEFVAAVLAARGEGRP
jgi:2-C-methyl-D-erythritol 4-phosphate cytidylyltransferase